MARPPQTIESFQAKRDDILNAATSILESDGSAEQITLRSIAKILNWSYSTAYRYFSSKEELLVALRIRAYSLMEYDLRQAIDSKNPNTKNLERLTHAYINAGIHRPSMYQLMFLKVDLEEADSDLVIKLNQAKRECLGVCADTMRDSQESGELSADVDPLTAAHLFWVSAHGIVSLQLADQLVMGHDIQQITHALLNVVLNGLQTNNYSSQYFENNSLHESPIQQTSPTL